MYYRGSPCSGPANTCNYVGKVYQRRVTIAGMANKLTSTQVTAMNTQKKGPASGSHCKCLKCPEQHHKPQEWPANILDEDAKADHSLIPVVILLKRCPVLDLPS